MAVPNRDARDAHVLYRLRELGYRPDLRDVPAPVTLDELAGQLRLDPPTCRQALDRLSDRGELDLWVESGGRLQIRLRRE